MSKSLWFTIICSLSHRKQLLQAQLWHLQQKDWTDPTHIKKEIKLHTVWIGYNQLNCLGRLHSSSLSPTAALSALASNLKWMNSAVFHQLNWVNYATAMDRRASSAAVANSKLCLSHPWKKNCLFEINGQSLDLLEVWLAGSWLCFFFK